MNDPDGRSLIDRMTAAAQAARDEFGYGTVTVTEHGQARTYRMREDWAAVADRAALKFARKGTADAVGAER